MGYRHVVQKNENTNEDVGMHLGSSGGHSSANLLISEAHVFVSGLAVPLTSKTIGGPSGPISFR